ncbi:MAG: hypothetical protein AAFX39_02215, partial [Pseudomonadota bacterium]
MPPAVTSDIMAVMEKASSGVVTRSANSRAQTRRTSSASNARSVSARSLWPALADTLRALLALLVLLVCARLFADLVTTPEEAFSITAMMSLV